MAKEKRKMERNKKGAKMKKIKSTWMMGRWSQREVCDGADNKDGCNAGRVV